MATARVQPAAGEAGAAAEADWRARAAPHVQAQVQAYVDKWARCEGEAEAAPPGQTGCGLCYVMKWGSLRYALTSSWVAALYARHFPESEAANRRVAWAASQLNYALGRNPLKLSYMIGFEGVDGAARYPRQPHHRAASCPAAARGSCSEAQLCSACDSPHVLYGAVVGGPDHTDCWHDDRSNYVRCGTLSMP